MSILKQSYPYTTKLLFWSGLFIWLCSITAAQNKKLSFDNYTIENGLSSNVTHCLFQDKRGWMWFGTNQGLNRFDGYKFTIFKNNPNDKKSLEGALVRVIFEDHNGTLWVGTEHGGLNKFNREKECFTRFANLKHDNIIEISTVYSIAEDKNNLLWIGTDKGLLQYNPVTGHILCFENKYNDPSSLRNNFVRVLKFDNAGKLWMGTNTGVDIFDPSNNSISHLKLPFSKGSDEIWTIYTDQNGLMWIGTYSNGLFICYPDGKLENFIPDPGNDRSYTVRSIVQDDSGRYWIGTRGGVYLYQKKNKLVSFFENDAREPASLCNNSVLDILKSVKGDIWIGTRGGISYMINDKQVFEHFKSIPSDNKYLNNNEVYVFWTDKKGDIWIGTEKGGINILDRQTGVFRYIMHDPKKKESLSKNCVKAFMDDHLGNVWVGTYMGGINIIDLKTGHIKCLSHDPGNPSSLADNKIWALLKDSRNTTWVGTDKGLDSYDDQSNVFNHYPEINNGKEIVWIAEDPEKDLWLGTYSEVIIFRKGLGVIKRFQIQARSLFVDSKNRFWLPTLQNGLALMDKKKGVRKYYDEKNGLVNNETLCVLEDNLGFLWITTANGISKFNPKTIEFQNFDKSDGLQNNQFLYGAGYKLPSGELLFGGITGFNILNPNNVIKNNYIPPVVFTDFKIFNVTVPVLDDKNGILTKTIGESDHIFLPFNDNAITLEFAALNYANSNKNSYAYFLKGFDKTWNKSGQQRTATYTNLNPGDYVFEVKVSNNANLWNSKGTQLMITILPPFWKKWWFKSLVILLILTGIYFIISFIVSRENAKQEIIFERIKANKLHELDMMKLRFFTNVSHEIRTPLTLIVGPVEKMLQNNLSPAEIKSQLEMMQRNSKQLLKLINQLLDFRKLEAGNLKIELSKGDVVAFVRESIHSFHELAVEKTINLKFNTIHDQIFTFFDPDKLDKILNNLLSNAFKFTGKDGNITVNLSLVVDNYNDSDHQSGEQKYIELVVRDSGAGIPLNDQKRIFDRFFQSKNQTANTGTGIGLTYTRELIKLLKGEIFVESKPGKGTKFKVRLPYQSVIEDHALPLSPDDALLQSVLSPDQSFQIQENSNESKAILLIVDDNADVRNFIKLDFETDFFILEAPEGKEGLALAIKMIPDIIISDIMMEGMDGNEMCRKLKKDERTSHIPVILLTALSTKENTMEGLLCGADDYITKPFDLTILHAKVENLLSLRKTLRDKYSGELVLQPTNVTLSSPDERFLKKAIETVEKNIDNSDLDIEQFSANLNVSRMQLYRKLSSLTGMTVKEFIKDIRLKRAVQLIIQKKLTIAEVAYSVGFKDLSHFRKCFREKFGMSATEYIERHPN